MVGVDDDEIQIWLPDVSNAITDGFNSETPTISLTFWDDPGQSAAPVLVSSKTSIPEEDPPLTNLRYFI